MIIKSHDPWKPLNYSLNGKAIVLEPLKIEHYEELKIAANDPAIWIFTPAHDFKKWFQTALEERQQEIRWPFAVRQLSNKQLVGSISYHEMDPSHRRGIIGRAWYNPAVWGTTVFPDSMFTLLRYGFEVLNLNRIGLRTTTDNKRSQRAIEKIGGIREGILRERVILEDNQPRDIVYYSILFKEWPKVKENLEKRLAAENNDSPSNQPIANYG